MQWTRADPETESKMQSLAQYSRNNIRLDVVATLAPLIVICVTFVIPTLVEVGLGFLITVPTWFGYNTEDEDPKTPAAHFVRVLVILIMVAVAFVPFIMYGSFLYNSENLHI